MTGKRSSGRQSLANLRGEIDFRAKLSRQHVTGEVLLPDYYKKAEHDSILDEREVRLISIRGVASQLDERVRLRNIPNALLGGTIAGLCRKKSDGEELRQFSIDDLLGCPTARYQ
jgi:hypothetical protein